MNFEDYVDLKEGNLEESSLSRVWKLTQEHDYGCITAYRYARDCGHGEPYTKAENKARNKSLLHKLKAKRFGITKIIGTYIENYGSEDAREVKEETFLVIDIHDSGKLKETLVALGEEFEQDSVLFGKAGETPVLIGTNRCSDAWPGYGVVKKLSKGIFGKKGEFFSRVNGRPFIFDLVEDKVLLVKYPSEIRGDVYLSKKDWHNFIEEEE